LLELLNLTLSVTQAPQTFRLLVSFPALFILPGVFVIVTFRSRVVSAQRLTVEGFFLSTIIAILLTALSLMLALPLTSLTYSGVSFLLVTILAITCLVRGIEFELEESDLPLLVLAFASFIGLFLYFSTVPRFFTPDETAYIFSARMGILGGVVPPTGGRPGESLLISSVDGRYFWTYLLISFISSSGLLPQEAGLISVSFVVMTALASSLFVERKWLSRGIFLAVLSSPVILSFSALTLNDLAVAFYTTIAGFYFIQTFSRLQGQLSIDTRNLMLAFLASLVASFLKENLAVLVSIWIITVFVAIRYHLYKRGGADRFLSLALILPALLYELLLDIPFFISVDILRNAALGSLFGRFVPISPTEHLVELFFAPWWNPTAKTLLTSSFANYLDYFYTLLMPESFSLIISSIILALPLLLWFTVSRAEVSEITLGTLVILLLSLYYVETLLFALLVDVPRYALGLVPLSVPLAFTILNEIKGKPTLSRILPPCLAGLVLLWMSVWLTIQKGGIYLGYSVFAPGIIPRTVSITIMLLELTLVTAILSLPFLSARFSYVTRKLRSMRYSVRLPQIENVVVCLIVVVILFNGVLFSALTVGNSQLYENRDFSSMVNTLATQSGNRTLVFANNYFQLRPYVDDRVLSQGLLLPPPATLGDFQDLLRTAPDGSLILISNDTSTTYYHYGSTYLSQYFQSDFITPTKPDISRLPRINLTQPLLLMTFDDANATTVPDDSGLGNNGANHGAIPVGGYYGKALSFNGSSYVSIPSTDSLNVQNQISISFLANIQAAEAFQGHMILSKGYAGASFNGSYDVFIWDSQIFFELGTIGFLSIPATPYVGSWHQFAFTYDGAKLEIFVDGIIRNSKQARGLIRASFYNLEIGRDSSRRSSYFVGLIDELQISPRPLNYTQFLGSYFSHYAVQVARYVSGGIYANIYRIVNQEIAIPMGAVGVEYSEISLESDLSIVLDIHLHSTSTRNVTVLIGTDRFTNIFEGQVSPGENILQYRFNYVNPTGGPYWLHLRQERIFVFDSGGATIYDQFVTLQDSKGIGSLVVLWCFGVLLSFLALSSKRRQAKPPQGSNTDIHAPAISD
jgi:concanavalin A-like lectin/glucanase superfamily protein